MISFILSIGKFIVANLDTIKIIGGLIATAMSTGLGILWQKKRDDQKNVEVKEIIAKGNEATEEEIKEVSCYKKHNSLTKFIINNLMLIGFCYFVHYLFQSSLYNPLFAKDIDYLQALDVMEKVFFLFIGVMIATRVASSITSFDSMLKALPIIKKFVK
jgi:glucose-6-phosphate-specific signal transduction histidine kinase